MRPQPRKAHIDQVAKPGDYITVDYVSIPLIIVRGEDGEIRAFANSCRHRGTPVADGSGNCRAFVCPYHGWAFRHDGALAGVPAPRGYAKSADLTDPAFALKCIFARNDKELVCASLAAAGK